jgi:spore coat protein U-like protein
MLKDKFNARMLTMSVAAALAMGSLPTVEAASPQSASLPVSATVEANCVIATTGVNFGAYDSVTTTTDLAAQGAVTVTCTTGANAKVTLDQGANAETTSSSTTPLRQLSSGGASPGFLKYKLYSDLTHSQVWGDDITSNPGNAVASTGDGSEKTLAVYGVIASGQKVPAGSYTDTVLAKVIF